MSALFISDLHLDDFCPERVDAFERLVDEVVPTFDSFYLLGDLVEVWVGDDDDSAFADRFRRILERAAAQTSVFVVHGNRDFLFGEAFASHCGLTILTDPSPVEIDGRSVLIAHGDGFCTDDAPYQTMRAVFRSPEWQQDMLARSLDERRAFAQSLRDRSRTANENKASNIMDVNADAVAGAMAGASVDLLIHGHTHRPAIHDVQHGRRVVLGDWGRCGWRFELSERPSDDRLVCFPVV